MALYFGMSLGTRIRLARELHNPRLTQQVIADKFGITAQAVSGWENDKTIPDLDKLPRLAVLLRVPLLWLLDGDGRPPPDDRLPDQITNLNQAERAAVSAMVESFLSRK